VKEPAWLTRDVILAVQDELLARLGGLAGIRDEGLLDSALARPQQVFAYEESISTFHLAAVYAHGLVKNHPFMDGNKRIGLMTAYIFLGINGYELDAPEEQAVVQTLALAAGDVAEAEYAEWLERSCTRT
jgi:death-on-curing protein